MSLTNEIISQTRITREIAEQLETAICRSEGIHVPAKLQLAIDAIPFQIAAAEAIGSSSAVLFELTEGVSFTIPEHIDPYKSERPRQEWLQGDVAIIFRYCVEADLSPTLAPFSQPSSGSLKSELLIDWTHTPFDARSCARSGAGYFDLESFHTGQIRIPYAQQERVRQRVSRALALAPVMLHNARSAIHDSEAKAELLCINNYRHSEKDYSELKHDVEALCGLFGLSVRFQLSETIQAKDSELQFAVIYRARRILP